MTEYSVFGQKEMIDYSVFGYSAKSLFVASLIIISYVCVCAQRSICLIKKKKIKEEGKKQDGRVVAYVRLKKW